MDAVNVSEFDLGNGETLHDITFLQPKKQKENIKRQIVTNRNKVIVQEKNYKNGNLHQDKDIPAMTMRYADGKLCAEFYYKNGAVHRAIEKPAIIFYNKDKEIISKKYIVNGELQRNEGVKLKMFYSDGEYSLEEGAIITHQ